MFDQQFSPEQEYEEESQNHPIGRFVNLKNNDPSKFQNIAKGANRLHQTLSKNLHSVTQQPDTNGNLIPEIAPSLPEFQSF